MARTNMDAAHKRGYFSSSLVCPQPCLLAHLKLVLQSQVIMGKKKQQKLYQLNNKKDNPAKQQMKDILKQLSEMKHEQQKKNDKLEHPLDLSLYKKKIKKEQKLEKYLRKKKANHEEEEEQEVVVPVAAPKLNIFAVDTYQSGVKTVINNKANEEMVDENKLANETNRLMGGEVSFETFGQKPLKIIENEEKVELSDDQNEPNSFKNITHPNIAIPTSNYVIDRTKEIVEFRQKLPIYMKEQEIVQTINNHLVTLICGETGSGKSTQIGQFLIEKNYHQFGKIAITQPRRLAAIALASRVADQINAKLGTSVGYQVRHERKDSPATLIKYLTDGILLNEMSSDYMLNAYSVIVVDEAHERKVNTDILIGLLSKLVLLRYKLSLQGKCHPLRLIIMSATMRVQDFQNTKLFDYTVPIINVEARMFPVTVYYQKQTPEDYREAAVKKCLKIHRKLPMGDVLIFLTGKEEIHEVAIMLEQALQSENHMDESDQEQQEEMMEEEGAKPHAHQIYCLYSSLPLAEQQKIFKPAPSNCRKFVISTNIAETSLTIPNIRYVIDSGQEKHRYHEGVWKWRKGWGSRAMAQQRSGRAGRTTHGYCYRLYSSALYANIMEEYPLPEICKLPLESVLLQLKTIGIPDVFIFPFPTAPQNDKIKATLNSLLQIKAIQGEVKQNSEQATVTQLGNVLSFLPLDPKLGKILLMGRKAGVSQHCLLLVILLTVQSIFLQDNYKVNIKKNYHDQDLKGKYFDQMKAKAASFKNKYKRFIMEGHFGDIFTSINILGQFFVKLYQQKGKIQTKIAKQASSLQLNQNVMRQIYYNADQIAQIYETLCNQKMVLSQYKQPNNTEIHLMLDILVDVFIHNLCRVEEKNKYKNKNQQIVLVHHFSDTYLTNNLFLCCTEFFGNQNGKTFMRYSFPVKNYELLATYGIVSPPSQFAWRDGRIVGLTTGSIFGWEIPNIIVQQVQNDIKYVFVAKYLLQGKILEQLKVFEKYLKAPVSIIKPGSLDYKVQKLVQKLKTHKIDRISAMLDWWVRDTKFLKEELRQWVQMKNYDQVYEKVRKAIQSIRK